MTTELKETDPIRIDYVNHKGVRRIRLVEPRKIYFGHTKWHPEKQWLLHAFDRDKLADRDFAMSGIIHWGVPVCSDQTDSQLAVTVESLKRAFEIARSEILHMDGLSNEQLKLVLAILDHHF